MLGAITRMLNVTISIVTPASGLVWNVYHDIATPDIVLIANGVDFEKGITHISATKVRRKCGTVWGMTLVWVKSQDF